LAQKANLASLQAFLSQVRRRDFRNRIEKRRRKGKRQLREKGRLTEHRIKHCAFSSEGYLEHMMDREWNDSQPIYRQLRDRIVDMILDGVLKEGDPLPSVRNVAAEYRVNPLTVLKGYQQLVDEQLVESKRGRGMFINEGARNMLLQGERQKFLAEQWPRVCATIQRLGLTPEELLEAASRSSNTGEGEKEPKP
jgi:GntR family transcriptional regulator